MGAHELLQHLCSRGVTLTPREDGNLNVIPGNVLTDDERAQIRALKPALLAYLRRTPAPGGFAAEGTELSPLCTELVGLASYAAQARRHGLSIDEAERLAEDLLRRDRQGLDLHACSECRHLESTGRCAAARAGRLPGADRRHEPIKTELVRCPCFRPSTTNTRATP